MQVTEVTVSSQIIEVLNTLFEQFGIAVDWTSKNVLPYFTELCNKYVNWVIAKSFAWIIIILSSTFIFYIASAILDRKTKKLYNHYNTDYCLTWVTMISWVIFGCLVTASIFVIACQVFNIIEAKTIPEKLILDYIDSFINSASSSGR